MLSLKEKLLVYNYSDIVRQLLTAIPPGIIVPGGEGGGGGHFDGKETKIFRGEGCDQLMMDEDCSHNFLEYPEL